MSKSKSNKKTLKIVGATGVALFSLVAVFTATIAWFALNHTVNSSGMSIKVKKNDISISEWFVYKYTVNGDVETSYDASMPEYDSIFIERNDKCGIVIKLIFSGETLVEGSTVSLSVSCTDDTIEKESISDIISVQCGMLNIYATTNEAIYAQTKETFEDTTTYNKHHFLNDTIKSTSIDFTFDIEATSSTYAAYFYIDYDVGLIPDSSVEFGQGSLATIEYTGDLDSISIDLVNS